MDDLLQKETERQRRLLEEARKAVEQEKARLRQGSARRIEPRLDESVASDFDSPEPRLEPVPQADETQKNFPQQRNEHFAAAQDASPGETVARLRSIPHMRSALIPLDENSGDAVWSKPFSLLKADMEPWLSYLRGYRESCLFPDAASGGGHPRVDAAVQALIELKGIDIKVILEPAVQINGPVEYLDEAVPDVPAGSQRETHGGQLAKAVEKGREMGNHLYDALLGEGYINLVQAWEKVHGRKPNVSELHFMLTTGRVKPPVELQPRQLDVARAATQTKIRAEDVSGTRQKKQGEVSGRKEGWGRGIAAWLIKISPIRGFRALASKLDIADKRKFLFHLFHLILICAAVAVYFVVMHVFD